MACLLRYIQYIKSFSWPLTSPAGKGSTIVRERQAGSISACSMGLPAVELCMYLFVKQMKHYRSLRISRLENCTLCVLFLNLYRKPHIFSTDRNWSCMFLQPLKKVIYTLYGQNRLSQCFNAKFIFFVASE